MRTVKIPLSKVKAWIENPSGRAIVFPVIVNWKELQLTEDQRFENAIALVNGMRQPHPDNSIFQVEVTD